MRALVVGLGHMGRLHRKVLADLGLDVTTVDPRPEALARYREVPAGRFDVVCIACPIAHLAERAAEWAGHAGWLLIEKPMAATIEQATELAGLLEGQRVAVGYVERFNPAVRALKQHIAGWPHPMDGVFIRHNDRPSPSVALDLTTHDADLACHLGLRTCQFFSADGMTAKRREIRITAGDNRAATADLLAHTTSPLHAQWHAFLLGRPDVATPTDAIDALRVVGSLQYLAAV